MKNTHSPFVIACPVMKNNKNISMIARSASCFNVDKLIITGQNKIDQHISRNIKLQIENHRSIIPVISKYKLDGYKIIGLEQSFGSTSLHKCKFVDVPTLLIVGNECRGIDIEIMECVDELVEINHDDYPHSLNVAVATSIFLYEYTKQLKRLSIHEDLDDLIDDYLDENNEGNDNDDFTDEGTISE